MKATIFNNKEKLCCQIQREDFSLYCMQARFPLLLPVGCVADFFVLLKLVTHHLKELVGVGTQVLH